MPADLQTKISNFLMSEEESLITTTSVIYQGIEEEPWISEDELRSIVDQAVRIASNFCEDGSLRQSKLLRILPETDAETSFGIAFEGVCSLRDLGVVKINKEKPLNLDQIKDNIEKLKGKLNRDSSSLYKRLYSDVVKKPVEELSWKDPLASQVISDESDIVKNLPRDIKKGFNKISRNMVPAQRPIVQELCREFIEDFRCDEKLKPKWTHNKSWKESEETTSCVVKEILSILKNIWNNPAFKPEVAKTLNEGTYQSTVIVPLIQVVLKNLPVGDSFFISTSEKQSIASANRKGEGVNDGLYWVRQSLNPDKEQFGIVGVQVAGNIFHLNVLVRDKVNVHRYYHLQPVEIPVQFSAEGVVSRFIETLLVLRNILITNLSLLYHAPVSTSERQKEDFST
ncbi:34214_t:CDS:2, partial [Racocetra persica]